MDFICAFIVNEHKRCDDLLLKAACAVGRLDWLRAEQDFQNFRAALFRHIDMEESVLFPVFEKTIPNAGYPLELLRAEHTGIKVILSRLADSLQRRNADAFILHSETFTLVMQQHSLKEEDIIYPALDRFLGSANQPLIYAMRETLTLSHAGTA